MGRETPTLLCAHSAIRLPCLDLRQSFAIARGKTGGRRVINTIGVEQSQLPPSAVDLIPSTSRTIVIQRYLEFPLSFWGLIDGRAPRSTTMVGFARGEHEMMYYTSPVSACLSLPTVPGIHLHMQREYVHNFCMKHNRTLAFASTCSSKGR